jgi:hypothetical protein
LLELDPWIVWPMWLSFFNDYYFLFLILDI